jgi:hypothetical protein
MNSMIDINQIAIVDPQTVVWIIVVAALLSGSGAFVGARETWPKDGQGSFVGNLLLTVSSVAFMGLAAAVASYYAVFMLFEP